MYDFKRIVVGLELGDEGKQVSPGSRKAAEQALWVAKANGGSILFVHSTYDDEYHGVLVNGQPVVHEGLSDEGSAALDAVVDEAREAGVSAELRVRTDRAWLEITRQAMAWHADLVIVGKRSASSDDGRRLGNVATKLLRKCPTPVWVVKPEHDLVHRCVLAATDLTPVGDLAVACAAYVAARQGCDLHVVHAWQMPMALQLESSRMSEEEFAAATEAIKQACVDHVKRSLAAYEGPVEPRIHTSKGAPAQTIRDAVTHLDPDLLVMGTISRAGLAGVLIGSTAERLLDRVDCSILTVKPTDFVTPVGEL